MAKRAAPHRGIDVHYGDSGDSGDAGDAGPQQDSADPADDATEGDQPYTPRDSRPSKTKMKQRSHDLQTLGVAVAALPETRLAAIDMPEPLRDAIMEFRRTKSHEGKRRQMQYVGKLMHNADEAVLREAVAEATLGTAQHALALHLAERWRAELVADDNAMTRWLKEHPDTDTQQLRSLVRAARRDATSVTPEDRQPKSFRELFQFIKPMLGNEGKDGDGDTPPDTTA